MRFNVISYLIGEGFRNTFKNKKSTISSLTIMCATMLIFGLFFIIGENINAFVENVAEAQEIKVVVENDATDQQIEEVGKEILDIDGVKNAEYISKDEALDSMKEWLGNDMVEGYEERNIFSASYNVTLTDLELNDEVQKSILEIPNVKKIESSNKVIEQVIRLAKGVKIVTGVILVLLIAISTSIIANTIKLTVHARRKEISIMKYVGATNGFIRWPFMVEGMLIGLISVLISLLILAFSYNAVITQIEQSLINNRLNIPLLTFPELFQTLLIVYLVLGIGIGALGSAISMKKYLEV